MATRPMPRAARIVISREARVFKIVLPSLTPGPSPRPYKPLPYRPRITSGKKTLLPP